MAARMTVPPRVFPPPHIAHDADPAAACALSVVVGSVDSGRTIARALAALEQTTRGMDAEIIVVDASEDGTRERVREMYPRVRLRELPAGTLTPKLWSTGFAMSRGRVVAFTTGHCVVSPAWARAMLAGIERGCQGVSGPLALSKDSGVVDWALFYLRYAAFISGGSDDGNAAHEIPGDNAAYDRAALERHAFSFADGFWEVDFHRRLRAESDATRFVVLRDAGVDFGPSASFGSLARQRFHHGRHSGAWRALTGARSTWASAAAAPLVPVVLVARIARRVLPRPSHRARFLIALPVTFALAVAWAAGEAWGALADRRTTTLRNPRFAA